MRKARNGAASVCVLALAALVTGCPKDTAIWVQEGSTAGNLVFVLGKEPGKPEPVGIGVLSVRPCGATEGDRATALWIIEGSGGTQPLERVRYGITPQDFVATVEAKPIGPGCYRVDISGSGETTFEIDRSGAVRTASAAR
jgi:hypothetical protein